MPRHVEALFCFVSEHHALLLWSIGSSHDLQLKLLWVGLHAIVITSCIHRPELTIKGGARVV